MNKNNPAIFECPKNTAGIHAWMRMSSGRSICMKCKLELSEAHTAEVFNSLGYPTSYGQSPKV